MSDFWRALDKIRNHCRPGGSNEFSNQVVSFEKEAVDAAFFRQLDLKASQRFDAFLRNATNPLPFVCKLLYACLLGSPIHLGHHASRDAIRYSIVQCVTSFDINLLETTCRLDSLYFSHVMQAIVLPSVTQSQTKQLLKLGLNYLLYSVSSDSSGFRNDGEAVAFGHRFELCVYYKYVLALFCLQKAFPNFPARCPKPEELLRLGHQVKEIVNPRIQEAYLVMDEPLGNTADTSLAQKQSIGGITYTIKTLNTLVAALRGFSVDDEQNVSFLVVHTPRLVSIDIVVAVATKGNIDISLIECKYIFGLTCIVKIPVKS